MTTPDWAAIEAAYRDGDVPVARLLRQHGITRHALYARARAMGWPLRRTPARPPAAAGGPDPAAPPADMTMPMLQRLMRTLARHIDDLEESARCTGRTERDRERDAKALAALAAVLDRMMEIADRLDAARAATRATPADETAESHDALIAALAERVACHRRTGAGEALSGDT